MPDDSPFIGQIMLFAGSNYTRGISGNGTWMPCDGRLLPVQQYQALFSVISNTYGGDGRKDFALPDMRGLVPVGSGQGPGKSPYHVGQLGGQEQVTKTFAVPLPEHTHGAQVTAGTAGDSVKIEVDDAASSTSTGLTPLPYDPATSKGNMLGRVFNGTSALKAFVPYHSTGHYLGGVSGGGAGVPTVKIDAAGTKSAGIILDLDIRQPFLAMPYYICVEGIYPVQLD